MTLIREAADLIREAEGLVRPYFYPLDGVTPSRRRVIEAEQGAYLRAVLGLARRAAAAPFEREDVETRLALARFVRGTYPQDYPEGSAPAIVLWGLNRAALRTWGPWWCQASRYDLSTLEVRGDAWIARNARGYACYGHAAPSTSRALRGAIVDTGELGDLGWWEGRGGERAREWLARARSR